MDVRTSFASDFYLRAKPATAPAPDQGTGMANALGQAVQSFADTLSQGDQVARAAMTGGADPLALVQAMASAQLAVETVSTVRDRVVEAYQEILRMPV